MIVRKFSLVLEVWNLLLNSRDREREEEGERKRERAMELV